MDFVGYEKWDKLIWTSGEGFRNKNATKKQDIPKININMTSTSSILGFVCYPHKDTYGISSEYLVSRILQEYL